MKSWIKAWTKIGRKIWMKVATCALFVTKIYYWTKRLQNLSAGIIIILTAQKSGWWEAPRKFQLVQNAKCRNWDWWKFKDTYPRETRLEMCLHWKRGSMLCKEGWLKIPWYVVQCWIAPLYMSKRASAAAEIKLIKSMWSAKTDLLKISIFCFSRFIQMNNFFLFISGATCSIMIFLLGAITNSSLSVHHILLAIISLMEFFQTQMNSYVFMDEVRDNDLHDGHPANILTMKNVRMIFFSWIFSIVYFVLLNTYFSSSYHQNGEYN